MSLSITDLSGSWKYITDEKSNLRYEEIEELFKSSEVKIIKVPANWESQSLHNFCGSVWYRREFVFTPGSDDIFYTLRFHGIDYFAEVWLNGKYIGQHEGYFQRFDFDVTKIQTSGNNMLLVKVTSPREEPGKVWPNKKQLIKGIFCHHDCRPGGSDLERGQDKNTGGIWNKVELIAEKDLIISNALVAAQIKEKTNSAYMTARIVYYSPHINEKKKKLIFRIINPSGDVTNITREINLKQGNNEYYFVTEINEPVLWWSHDLGSSPLYSFEIIDGDNTLYADSFGIREIYLDEKETFFLNKKRLFLRGTNIIPAQLLSELTQERIDLFIRLMKEANINIVRVHAHVTRKEFYAACDKAGIMVWQDFPLQWTYDTSQEFAEKAVMQIQEIVHQYYNHPSIVFWCCHNEPGEQIDALDSLLFDAVKREDTTRIIRQASNYEEHAYDGWYWGDKEHYAATPMGPLVTEFGAQALPAVKSLKKFINNKDIFPPDWEVWKYHNFQYEQTFKIAGINTGKSIEEFTDNSQDYQAELISTAVHYYRRERFKRITGIFQFMLVDCWESISWSVVDYYGIPKKGYYALKEAYSPLLLSVRLRQKRYTPGSKLNVDLFIINDLYKVFTDCRIVFSIKNKNIDDFPCKEIQPDSMLSMRFEDLNVYVPEKLNAGKHLINVELREKNDDVVASSRFEIIVERE